MMKAKKVFEFHRTDQKMAGQFSLGLVKKINDWLEELGYNQPNDVRVVVRNEPIILVEDSIFHYAIIKKIKNINSIIPNYIKVSIEYSQLNSSNRYLTELFPIQYDKLDQHIIQPMLNNKDMDDSERLQLELVKYVHLMKINLKSKALKYLSSLGNKYGSDTVMQSYMTNFRDEQTDKELIDWAQRNL